MVNLSIEKAKSSIYIVGLHSFIIERYETIQYEFYHGIYIEFGKRWYVRFKSEAPITGRFSQSKLANLHSNVSENRSITTAWGYDTKRGKIALAGIVN